MAVEWDFWALGRFKIFFFKVLFFPTLADVDLPTLAFHPLKILFLFVGKFFFSIAKSYIERGLPLREERPLGLRESLNPSGLPTTVSYYYY